MASKKKKTAIKYTDIFKPLAGQDKPIRTVMTKGVAGIGKTVSVQRFILDWTEGKANQEIDFLFPVSFREINLMKKKEYSLVDFIHHFFSETCDLIFSTDGKYKIAFIFDGLDESRQPLDFQENECIYSVSEPASVDALLTNLINRNLLPSAQIWITSRPAAADQIPPECVDQVTEVQGFTDQQKEEYFKKNINEQEIATRIITHLKRSRTLYIMCHIPVFCWMAATVLVSILKEGCEISASLTWMYIHFLIMQVKYMSQKYKGICKQKTTLSLGRLAFHQLEKGNMTFYEDDLRECGMDAKQASVYSGVCTQILREEAGLYQKKVFSFVHLSIQEFLAALYVFLCFSDKERNMSDQQQTSQLSALFRAATLQDLHKTALDLALQSRNGHLDLFLRFLLGLSLESNQNLLKDLLQKTSSQSSSSVQTVQCIKKKIRGERSSDRRINLFYCLNELNQHAVVERIDRKGGELSVEMLLPGEWKTVRFKLTMSEEQLDGFDLQKYIQTPEEDQTELLSPDAVLQKLVPVVTSFTKAE
ncbi:protein NLRC3-like [Engraulis encrasicolus]|uniref:protein NLRC3-like n=1 Tax=Engraulis encrasicolus TaxID=184585 RepID=UPI002FD18A95